VRESIEDMKRTPLSLGWFAIKLRSLVDELVGARRTNQSSLGDETSRHGTEQREHYAPEDR
jgi:hypothetical protein